MNLLISKASSDHYCAIAFAKDILVKKDANNVAKYIEIGESFHAGSTFPIL